MPSPRPLEGRIAVVACSPMKAGSLISGLERLGAQVVAFAAIEVRPIDDRSAIDAAIDGLDGYGWLLFTSTHAVLYFAEALAGRGRLGLPAGLKVCTVGTATAARARAAGFPVDLVPERFVGEAAAEVLAAAIFPGERVLFPRARVARDVIPERLRAAGARVDIVPVYETVTAAGGASAVELVKRRAPDLLVFTSSSTVTGFVSILGESSAREILHGTVVAAIGPVTAATAAAFGKKAEIVPENHTVQGVIESVCRYFAGR